MPIEPLIESPASPVSALGPYRREDFARLPEEPRCELLFGWFYVQPRPSPRHQAVLALLWRRLDEAARAAGGLALPGPLDSHLADHTVARPDLLYLSPARLALAGEWVEGPPDLVAEVLSPDTARRDRGEKLRAYAELGVDEYWLIDPETREVQFLCRRDGRFEAAPAPDGRYRSAALPELDLDLDDLWAEVDRRAPR